MDLIWFDQLCTAHSDTHSQYEAAVLQHTLKYSLTFMWFLDLGQIIDENLTSHCGGVSQVLRLHLFFTPVRQYHT